MTSAVPKPENALKRAEELISAGQSLEALNVLHATISNRKLKILGWDPNTELIMLRYVQRCVELDKLRLVREGLHYYRYLTQQHNVVSLAKVMKELRDLSEAKLEAAKSVADAEAISRNVDDLEAVESPETLLLASLQVEVRDETTQALNKALSGCWETYKIVMDLLRFAPKLEHVYHDTAQKALIFCKTYKRPQEFKRLCDTLRTQYLNCQKNRNKPDYEAFARPENHLSTRIIQIQVAADLNLWTQCFQIAEDILQLGLYEMVQKSLVSKDPNAQKTRSLLLQHTFTFYEKVAQMFFVSKQLLFHASAILRNIIHTRQHKKNFSLEEAEKMCDVGVMAVLCVPIYRKRNQTPLELEYQKRLTSMLAHNGIPTRESMQYAIETRNILLSSSPLMQKLYATIESEIDVLTICHETNKFVEEIEKLPHLAPYIIHLKHVVLEKLLLQLTKIYLSLKIDFLTTRILPESFLKWKEAEPLIADFVEHGFLKLRFDYSRNLLLVTEETNSPDSLLRNRIAHIATTLTDLMPKMVIPNKDIYKSFAVKAEEQFYENFPAKLEEEALRLSLRNNIVSERRRKQEEEQHAKEEAKKTEEKERQRKEELEEQARREIAFKQQEALRIKETQQQMRIDISKQILASFKSLTERAAGRLLIQGRPVEEITYEQIASGQIGYEDYEKAQEEVFAKERQEKYRQQKHEIKRMEHLIRAIREEEAILYKTWSEKQKEIENEQKAECLRLREKMIQHKYEMAVPRHVSFLKKKDVLLPAYEQFKAEYYKKYEEACNQRLELCRAYLIAQKYERAVFKKKSQEKLKEKEETEKQNRLKEEEEKARERTALIQKQKDEEIERKLEEERMNARAFDADRQMDRLEKPLSSGLSSFGMHDQKTYDRRIDIKSSKMSSKISEEVAWRRSDPVETPQPVSSGKYIVNPKQRPRREDIPKKDFQRSDLESSQRTMRREISFDNHPPFKDRPKPRDQKSDWQRKKEPTDSFPKVSRGQSRTKQHFKSDVKDSDGYTFVNSKRKQ